MLLVQHIHYTSRVVVELEKQYRKERGEAETPGVLREVKKESRRKINAQYE